jgi:pyruvate dehydrogenase E2 component (dihydrolipoamide acetyltransferase)
MAEEVFVPKYGQTVEEVTLIKWMAAEGAPVKKGQEILEIETDKTNFTLEAEANGFLHRGPYAEGQVVPVLTVVAIIGKEDEKFAAGAPMAGTAEAEGTAVAEAAPSGNTAEVVRAGEAGKVFASPRARKLAAEKGVDLTEVTPTGGEGVRVAERDVVAYLASAPKVTPVAQRLAEEAGIDLRTVSGTGPGGRITKEDVEKAVRVRAQAAVPTPVVRAAPAAPPSFSQTPSRFLGPGQLPAVDVEERVPLKGVRAIIADRMGTSVHTTARVTLMMDVDATEFVSVRERLKAKVSEEWGYSPGYNDLLAVMVAKALRNFPYMNARLAPDAIEILAHVNLGMAVDTERGLLVPVIRDADRRSLREFGAEFRALVDRARKGKSLPDDLSGGSFTITNLGMFDIEAFTPIINMPEAAILGVGRIIPKWVYRPESPTAPVLRQMMALSLVFDHRVVDGAPAARFLQYIKWLIEEPYLLLAA